MKLPIALGKTQFFWVTWVGPGVYVYIDICIYIYIIIISSDVCFNLRDFRVIYLWTHPNTQSQVTNLSAQVTWAIGTTSEMEGPARPWL